MSLLAKYWKILTASAAFLVLAAGLGIISINYYVERTGARYIFDASTVPEGEAILILGAYVFPDGTLSDMLDDRVTVGYQLYSQGKAPKILVSGDHGRVDYDEVNSMKNSLKSQGVPGPDIFMDHAGFSTYESIYRPSFTLHSDFTFDITVNFGEGMANAYGTYVIYTFDTGDTVLYLTVDTNGWTETFYLALHNGSFVLDDWMGITPTGSVFKP